MKNVQLSTAECTVSYPSHLFSHEMHLPVINFLLIHVSRETHISTKCTYQSNAHLFINQMRTSLKSCVLETWSLLEQRPAGSGGNCGISVSGVGFDIDAARCSAIFFSKEWVSTYRHNLITFSWNYCEAKKLISLRKAQPFKEAQHAANSFWTSCHTCKCSKNAYRLLKKVHKAQCTSW